MRTIITIILITILIAVMAACSQKKETYNEVALLIDITDSQSFPPVEEIMPILHPENIWDGSVFTLSTISDLSITKTYEASIEPINKWNGSEKLRKKEIKKFNSEVSRMILNISKTKQDKNNSAVYIAISEKLTQLTKSTAQKKTLIIFSDLLENTSNTSFYRKNDLNLISSNPEAIITRFEKIAPLPDLTGININIVHQPINTKQDELFRKVSTLYKSMLERHNAQVNISASL